MNKFLLTFISILCTTIAFGDGGSNSSYCTETLYFKTQKATFSKHIYTLISYKINGKEIPLTDTREVLYNNNTDWVKLTDLKTLNSYKTASNQENTVITNIELQNSSRKIYFNFKK